MEKVTIIMPCYNDGQYITESINSVLQQTYKNIELVIIDDGSDDENTKNILSSLCNEKIKIYRSNRLRPAGARNFGIEKSTGKYILPVDADDLIDKTYVEKCVNILEENEHIGVVYCEADLFGEKKGKWDLPSYSLEHMLIDNIVFVTAMFRREDWMAIGGFDINMKNGMEDYDFWLSILELNRDIYQIPEILFHYRIKKISRTTLFNSNQVAVKDTYEFIYYKHKKLYEKYMDIYSIGLRNALIEHIFLNRKVVDRFNKFFSIFPNLKKFIKSLLKNN